MLSISRAMSTVINGNEDRYVHSTDKPQPNEEEISQHLLTIPSGHHYLILYSNIETMRKVYSSYIKRQLEAQPDSIVLFLSYYDTTEKVRDVLNSKGIQVKEHERNGSIIILDIAKVVDNPFFEVPDIERLRELTKKLEREFKDKTIFIIADMSVFHHLNKAAELLEYEKNLHADLKIESWKELCLYHKQDFRCMFTKDESNKLMAYHKDKVIVV
jgi:hypothetical protein